MIRQTSIDVYREIEANGLLSARRLEVYKSVYAYGPCTSGEAFARVGGGGHPLSQSRARFTELRDMGVLQEIGERECNVSGHRCIVWDVTDKLPTKIKKTTKQVDKGIIAAAKKLAASHDPFAQSEYDAIDWTVLLELIDAVGECGT